jgi:molybdate transport system substrate-binding protein
MTPTRTVALAVSLLAALAVGGCLGGTPTPGPDGETGGAVVRVAAASDLKFALDEVRAVLAEADRPMDLRVAYGSSGTFFQQISNGAPFDVFLSADVSYPTRLVEAGLAATGDVFPYAVGRLVVWAPSGSPVDVSAGLAGLADPRVRTVAIANPQHAPYGKAAVAAMTSAGVYEAVKDKLVLGENVAQAAEFAVSGNAEVGVFALSLALAAELSSRGTYVEVPLDTFPRLDQGGVVLGSAADRDAASRLRDFLTGPDGIAILKRYGFSLPGA